MSKLPMERQQEILNHVNSRGIVKLRDLVSSIEGSESTIRRDIRELEQLGLLRSARGGVVSIDRGQNVSKPVLTGKKAAVGLRAAELIEDNETVVLDCGTTVMEMVKAIDPLRRFTCVTTSLEVAAALCEKPQVEVIMIGGAVNAMDKTVTGAMAEEHLRRFHINRYFLGAAGISEEHGVTGFNLNLIEIRKSIINLAEEVTVLADSSKFGKTGVATVTPLSSVQRLVTDSSVDEQVCSMLEGYGIQVFI